MATTSRLLTAPRVVLLLAIVLPGAGHVALGETRRALGFLFFIAIGAWLTHHFAPPGVSLVGQHAAGVFVYALSITDAYRRAAQRRAAHPITAGG